MCTFNDNWRTVKCANRARREAIATVRYEAAPVLGCSVVLIAVERLLIKLRQPASRAVELIELRRRLRAERAAAIDDEERALAATVHARKLAVVEQLTDVTSCASCAIARSA